MKNVILAVSVLAACGCASTTVRPITADDAAAHHDGDGTKSGYIVYAPRVLILIGKNEKGECTVSPTMTIPDFKRPYVLDSSSGFGKAGAEFTITDGWRLGGFKDASDNSAISVAALTKIMFRGTSDACAAPGFYEVKAGSLAPFNG